MPTPTLFSKDDSVFWESIEQRSMRLQRCEVCNLIRYPPAPVCPNCLSPSAMWTAVSGKGLLLSWTTFHRQYLPAYPAPHTVVAVALNEGPIMIGYAKPTDVPSLLVGARVEVRYEDHVDGYTISYFSIVDES